MFTRHQLTCQRAGCGRAFTATRSDALYCSRRCRRDKSIPAAPVPNRAARPAPPVEGAPAVTEDDLDGWRRLPGGLLAPPFDQNNVVRVDWFGDMR
jgi:hypothetical protein